MHLLALLLQKLHSSINAFFKNAIVNKVQNIKSLDAKTKILKQIQQSYIKICVFFIKFVPRINFSPCAQQISDWKQTFPYSIDVHEMVPRARYITLYTNNNNLHCMYTEII